MILPNLTDPQIFELEGQQEYINGKITIGYCGTPTRKDGVNQLIDSFAQLTTIYDNLHLLIIGDVVYGRSIIPQLKAIGHSYGISDHITFTGLVPFSIIPKLLNSCQILALTRPSGVFAQAGFPTKLGEYFACKKPVLITSVGDIGKYFVNKKHVVLTEPDNIESIVTGFRMLIDDDELKVNLIINASEWLDDNLNYRKLTNKISNFVNY